MLFAIESFFLSLGHVKCFDLIGEFWAWTYTVDKDLILFYLIHEEVSWVEAHDCLLVTNDIDSEYNGMESLVNQFNDL